MDSRVRLASRDDLDALAALVARANLTYRDWAGATWEVPGLANERLHWEARLEDGAAWSAVAVSDEELVGCVSFTDARTNAGGKRGIAGFAHLSRMFVDPNHWRTGLGSALLGEATAKMHESGYEQAQLFTATLNTGSRRFYEHHGWQPGTETRDWQGLELIRYTLDL